MNSMGDLPAILGALDVGMEADWQPDHLPMSAWQEHIPFAFWLVKTLRPRSIVELGTHYGASYGAFCQAVLRFGLDTRCHAVDTWQGDEHAGLYGDEVFQQVSALNEGPWRGFSTLLRMTFDQAREKFAPGEIDLLHIDGLHTYEAVLADFNQWKDTVSERGVVLFHDINVLDRGFGVWRLWRELSAQHPHFTFLHGYGLGVLGLGTDLPEPVRRLFATSTEEAGLVRRFFAARGGAVRAGYLVAEMERRAKAAEAAMVALQAEVAEAVRQAHIQAGQYQTQLDAADGRLREVGQELAEQARMLAAAEAALKEKAGPQEAQDAASAALKAAEAAAEAAKSDAAEARRQRDVLRLALRRARLTPLSASRAGVPEAEAASTADLEPYLREIAWLREVLDEANARADRAPDLEPYLQEITWLRESLAAAEAQAEHWRARYEGLRARIKGMLRRTGLTGAAELLPVGVHRWARSKWSGRGPS